MAGERREMHPPVKFSGSGQRRVGLFSIALFKLVKSALFLAVGIGALSLLHKSMADQVSQWVTLLHADPDNRYLHVLIDKLGATNARSLKEFGAGTFFYAALTGTEGVGLLLRKRWAEYLTVIATGSFIPLELYEMLSHFGMFKVIVVGINLLIVWYLVRGLSGSRRGERNARSSPNAHSRFPRS
jgi:uncharacterized membrane protein (DUF2068 family)